MISDNTLTVIRSVRAITNCFCNEEIHKKFEDDDYRDILKKFLEFFETWEQFDKKKFELFQNNFEIMDRIDKDERLYMFFKTLQDECILVNQLIFSNEEQFIEEL